MRVMTATEIKRGDVWWVAFDPALGGEIRKTRPAVVVSNDSANRNLNRLQAVPLTSSIDRLYPAEVYITFDGKTNKAMADQITTVAKERLRGKIGELTNVDIRAVEQAIRIQLDL